MSNYPWPTPIWEPRQRAFEKSAGGKTYTVRVAVTPAATLHDAWKSLKKEYRHESQKILDGGAVLKIETADNVATTTARATNTETDTDTQTDCASSVEIASGGEDALSSISWSINCTLYQELVKVNKNVQVSVVDER